MLLLYENEFSSCSTKVRIALSEKQAAWSRRRVDLLRFEQKTSAFLRLNPNGQVPTAVVDERGPPLVESHIILQYVDDAFSGITLSPREAATRARMRMWLKLIDEAHGFAGLLVAAEVFIPFWRQLPARELSRLLDDFARPEDASRIRYIVTQGIGPDRLDPAKAALVGFFERLDRHLAEHPWLAGEDFTLADIALTPYVDSQVRAITGLWYGRSPSLTRWLRAVRARDSYDTAVRNVANGPDMDFALSLAPSGAGWRDL